jgi:hypothetical protein
MAVMIITIQSPIEFLSISMHCLPLFHNSRDCLRVGTCLLCKSAFPLTVCPHFHVTRDLCFGELSHVQHFQINLDRVLCGAFAAFNLVCLFCFLQTPKTVRLTLQISGLFVMAEATANDHK